MSLWRQKLIDLEKAVVSKDQKRAQALIDGEEEINEIAEVHEKVKRHYDVLFRAEKKIVTIRDETKIDRDLFKIEDIEKAIKACNFQ